MPCEINNINLPSRILFIAFHQITQPNFPFFHKLQKKFKGTMKDQQFYSDSQDQPKSNQSIEEEQKPSNNRQVAIQKHKDIFSSDNLLKDSGISGIPLQKHKYANKIKTISTDIVSKDLAEKAQLTLKKQTSLSSTLLNNFNNYQDDGNSSLNYPQNNKSISAVDKRQRNKQSAKMSRDRKKLYIEMLEEKQKGLTKKLLSRKKQLQETKNYLDRVVNQNKAMSGFTASRHQMIKNLENVLQSKDIPLEEKNVQINQIIDNLRYRIGAAGKQRISTINQYFRQIVNLSLPALHRYMMWSATQQNHLFSKNQQEQTDDWYKQLKQSLNLTEEQKKQVESKKEFLQQQKKVLEKLIGKLKNIKTEIEEKSIELEDLIDEIRSILTPVQCANFILFIEKNKYRKELNLCDQLQQESREKIKIPAQPQDNGPRKIVKTESNSS